MSETETLRTFGRWIIAELEPFTGKNLGLVRMFEALGPRGAVYGCMLYEDGRWVWTNLRSPLGSVPFDLAQINPSTL